MPDIFRIKWAFIGEFMSSTLHEDWHTSLDRFIETVKDIPWLSHSGEDCVDAIVAEGFQDAWIGWNGETYNVWGHHTHLLETRAQTILGDAVIDEVFSSVSKALEKNVYDGIGDYFERQRERDEDYDAAGVNSSLYPEVMDSILRDMCWAAVEHILNEHDFFTMLIEWYRKGRWPCSWDGEYPVGKIVIL